MKASRFLVTFMTAGIVAGVLIVSSDYLPETQAGTVTAKASSAKLSKGKSMPWIPMLLLDDTDQISALLVTPYVNETDMREVNDFFNAQYSEAPWGRIHDGLDIDPDGNLKSFQAACAGRVKKLYKFDDQVMLLIDCDSTYTIGYNFEAQAPNTGQAQHDNILVAEGQLVAQGEVIGHLYSAENPEDAHVHFTLYKNAVPICPAPHFTKTAHDSILNVIAVVVGIFPRHAKESS